MKRLALLLIIISSISASAQEVTPQSAVVPFNKNMFVGVSKIFVTDDAIQRSGTVFIGQYHGKAYGITAAHIFGNNKSGDSVKIILENAADKEEATYKIYKLPYADMALFYIGILSESDLQLFPELQHSSGFRFGDPILYLGYPSINFLNAAVPIQSITIDGKISPLIKRGYFSGVDQQIGLFILDTQNLTGFSGSPLYILTGNHVQLIGVMGGGYNANITQMQNGKLVPLNDTFYLTGLSYAIPIDIAIEIIEGIK